MTQPVTTPDPYADWQPTLDAIAAEVGSTLLLGGTDVGKTTFTRLLVNRLTGDGVRLAVIDSDLGQSEIGPPACIGMALTDAPVQALSDLPPHALAFVGSTSPPGYLLEHVTGIRRLADLAAPHPVIVDTGGFINGSSARRLIQSEIELLQPRHLVALQRAGELEPILAPLRRIGGSLIHTPAVPAALTRKPQSFRVQRRTIHFAAYFQGATQHTYSLDQISLVGTWLGSGDPVAAHLLKFLNQCFESQVKVYYAEMSARNLGLMVNRAVAPNAPALSVAMDQLKAHSVSVTVAQKLKHLLLGLEGSGGKMMGLGLLEAIDFRRGTLGVLTPVRAPAAAHVLRFGGVRIAPNGVEVGALRPGELL